MAAGGDLDSCVDWVCAFFHPGNFKRTDGKHKAWAHPNQGVDEGILKPTSLISNAKDKHLSVVKEKITRKSKS